MSTTNVLARRTRTGNGRRLERSSRIFGVTNRNETKRDLLILITPHIVDEGESATVPDIRR